MTQTSELITLGYLNGNINKQTWGTILINVRTFGAKGDGTTDDTASIQSALDAAGEGGTVLFPDNGTYLVSSNLIISKSMDIIGYKCTLKIKNGSRIRYIFKADTIKSIGVHGITFDMNVQNTTPYVSGDYASGSYNEAIYCTAVTEKIEITNCRFINLYNEAISLYTITAPLIHISNNYFSSPAQTQNLRATHIQLQTITANGSLVIEENVFDNTQPSSASYGVNAIFLDGVNTQTVIRKNKGNWCGRDNAGAHRLLAIDIYGNSSNITIADNTFDNCLWGFIRIDASQNVTIKRNKFSQNGGVVLGDPGIWVSCNNTYALTAKTIKILENDFYVYSTSRVVQLISIISEDWNKVPTDIKISGNSLYGRNDYFVASCASVDTVRVINNTAHSFDGYKPKKLFHMVRSFSGNHTVGTEATTTTKGVLISGNDWESDEGAISVDLTSYTGTLGYMVIENNKLIGQPGLGPGIIVKYVPTIIRNNYFSNSPEAVNVYGNKQVFLFNNIGDTMGSGMFYFDASATIYDQAYNYYNGTLVP